MTDQREAWRDRLADWARRELCQYGERELLARWAVSELRRRGQHMSPDGVIRPAPRRRAPAREAAL
jgi:hypothetical protein